MILCHCDIRATITQLQTIALYPAWRSEEMSLGTRLHGLLGTRLHELLGARLHRLLGTRLHRLLGTRLHRLLGTRYTDC